ncbi:MAG: hypothetical protein JXA50_08080 [Deltaproteobacteria bacterium]|nr:hypothetical protein [Deltaproteobacteria bacterium]
MKLLRVLIGIIMGLSFAGSVVLLALANPLWEWGVAIIALCFAIAALGKALYLRVDTLRGKFHVLLGAGALTLCIAIVVGLVSATPWHIFGVHYLARFILILSVLMMFMGLMKQGYTLSGGDWSQVFIVFAILAAIALWLFYSLYAGATVLMSILIYLSLFLMLETISVIRVYLGSNLGWRWTAGALSVMCITVGDMGMAYSATSGLVAWEIVQYMGWGIMATIMCIISLMWD